MTAYFDCTGDPADSVQLKKASYTEGVGTKVENKASMTSHLNDLDLTYGAYTEIGAVS